MELSVEMIIRSKIFEVRKQKVMLDFDLAQMYSVENRALKQAVKRNRDRFPEDFMFELSKMEWQELITNCDKLPDTVKFSPATPYAFTEQGVAMLSSILKSKKAIQLIIWREPEGGGRGTGVESQELGRLKALTTKH